MNTTQKAILLDLFHKNAKAKATGKFKEAEEKPYKALLGLKM